MELDPDPNCAVVRTWYAVLSMQESCPSTTVWPNASERRPLDLKAEALYQSIGGIRIEHRHCQPLVHRRGRQKVDMQTEFP